jgi:hypothetical protein
MNGPTTPEKKAGQKYVEILVHFCGFHGNGSHFEKCHHCKSTYSWGLSFL